MYVCIYIYIYVCVCVCVCVCVRVCVCIYIRAVTIRRFVATSRFLKIVDFILLLSTNRKLPEVALFTDENP